MKDKKRNEKVNFRIGLIVLVALVFLLVASVILSAIYILLEFDLLTAESVKNGGFYLMGLFAFVTTVIGTAIFLRIFFKPIFVAITALEKLSEGDYSVRLDLGKSGAKKELSDTFNSLAIQLGNTTILREDFINNFSHEFKTPIVSMKGLLGLLKKKDLSPVKRRQYLNVVEEELDRLASMATNVLNLTKIENESILTGVTTFDVSEQIRTCILLLEKKWEKKKLEFSMDFPEYFVSANEDLLKEVWINLLDNAIKFSPDNGVIGVDITKNDGFITVSITNNGERIKEEDLDKIFNKFYSKTTASSGEGNGIGLAIVKHIVDLHGGSATVKSDALATTFTVSLPEERYFTA